MNQHRTNMKTKNIIMKTFKYYSLLLLFLPCFANLYSQNAQLHYDFDKDRQMLTSTIEMFKPDKLGNTFFFIDFDYGSKASNVNGVDLAYFEIARVLKTDNMPIGLHAEFNGGFGQFKAGDTYKGYQINRAYLAGIDYTWNSSDFSKGFSIKTLYKYITDKEKVSFQITGVWHLNILNKKVSFTGFADFWREDSDFNFDGTTDAKFIFLTEPQLWYNFNETIALGSEIELSNNFGGHDGFMINPTMGLKWSF